MSSAGVNQVKLIKEKLCHTHTHTHEAKHASTLLHQTYTYLPTDKVPASCHIDLYRYRNSEYIIVNNCLPERYTMRVYVYTFIYSLLLYAPSNGEGRLVTPHCVYKSFTYIGTSIYSRVHAHLNRETNFCVLNMRAFALRCVSSLWRIE